MMKLRVGFYVLSILLLAYGLTLMGCLEEDCDFKEEPLLYLSFEEAVSFSVVYGLKDTFEPIQPEGEQIYWLPIDLNSDRTIYVFESDHHTDTLELLYEVNPGLESSRCGVTVSLENFTVGSKSTFDFVEVSSDLFINVR